MNDTLEPTGSVIGTAVTPEGDPVTGFTVSVRIGDRQVRWKTYTASAAAVMRRLNAHCVERPRVMNLRLISGAMVAAMLGLIAAIWLLRIA